MVQSGVLLAEAFPEEKFDRPPIFTSNEVEAMAPEKY
jgi:hypothetical protein